jgi:pimeloyl-ACP methyl ester carboxylesterase
MYMTDTRLVDHAQEVPMAQFVLVPGAWLGGWAWRKVRRRLEAAGHEVVTPTLTGLGERRHLANETVGLATHVEDVRNLIRWEGLDDIVLVGHSLGGLVAAAVADQVPGRVRRVVYVDAIRPVAGRSAFDAAGPDYRAYVEERARATGDGWLWPMPEPEELDRFLPITDMSEEDRRWFWAQATPQPVRLLSDPLALTGAGARIDTTWVHCSLDPDADPPELPGDWTVRALPTGHWPMITMPDELADILREAAEASASRYPMGIAS